MTIESPIAFRLRNVFIKAEITSDEQMSELANALRELFSWHSRGKGIGYSCTVTCPGRLLEEREERAEERYRQFLDDEAPELRAETISWLAGRPENFIRLWDLGLVDMYCPPGSTATNVVINLEGAKALTDEWCRELISFEEHFRRKDQEGPLYDFY